ncbi:MAG: glycosyltransferase family 39 protein [Anaerolineae bacterium]|nr:glycosyltransferase family 39 protein [Anaerolineae bacterium]
MTLPRPPLWLVPRGAPAIVAGRIGPRPVRVPLALLVGILLVIFASRVARLPTLNMEKDEAWSTWITLGSVQQTLDWVGYDWPVGFFLQLHAWRALTGITPFGLRILIVLTMLVGAALVFRLARRLFGVQAGLLAMLAFGAFGYILFISTIVRGYMLNVALFVLALLLAKRYFDRPHWRRALWVALTFAAMIYVHTTAVFAIGMVGLYTLIAYPGLRMWIARWILPGLVTAILCAPEIANRLYVYGVKRDIVDRFFPYAPPGERLANHYLDYFGQQPALWAALFLIAALLIVERFRIERRVVALAVWMLMPVALMPITANIDAFNARHLAWVMVGFALWIGWGLAQLPRAAKIGMAVVLAALMFDHIPLNERYETVPRIPFVTSFSTLQHEWRNGDAIVRDLDCRGCPPIDMEEWDYFTRAYFPNGLTFIDAAQAAVSADSPVAYRRVWYVAYEGNEAPDALAAVANGRAVSREFGEESFFWRLYEAPPDPLGVLFENGMRFHGAEILNDANLSLVWREGDTVRLRLWWSADAPVALDYSVGAYSWSDERGGVMSQVDGPPMLLNGPPETSRWQPGQMYIEERELELPYPLATGAYGIRLAVYQWWDGVRIPAPGTDENTMLRLGNVWVKAW